MLGSHKELMKHSSATSTNTATPTAQRAVLHQDLIEGKGEILNQQ
jgi:hemin uptake protein HemP